MVVGKELIQIEARRNNGEFAQITVLVRTIQLFAFVVRAGYHHIGFPDGPLFLSNSRRHGVVVLNPLFRIAYAGKIVVLVSTQRVSCEHQRCMEVAGNLSGNVSTIGIVSVNDIGNALFGSEELDQIVNIFIQMWPELLLANVLVASARETDNTSVLSHILQLSAVVAAESFITYSPGEQIHLNILSSGELLHEIDHIPRLPSGIGITPHFNVVATH